MNLFLKGGEVASENTAPARADVWIENGRIKACLLYTSDAADE